jgi:hypothetical protein
MIPPTLTKRVGVAFVNTKGVELAESPRLLPNRIVEMVYSFTTSRQQTSYVAHSKPRP